MSVRACGEALRGALARLPAYAATDAGSPARLVVGFSGGLDSSVLLHVARQVAGIRTVALHVNHGLQNDADRWQRHCEQVCADAGIALLVQQPRLDGPLNEARARQARYGAFKEAIGAGDVLLLAHHLQDQVETLLLHLLQGRGVFGMPEQRPLGAGRLLRPFLGLARAELAAYAEQESLAWIEDESNLDVTHDRNFLRHRVLPLLSSRFPGIVAGLPGLAARQRALESALESSLGIDPGDPLPLLVLTGYTMEERATILRLWLRAHELEAGSHAGLLEFARQLDTPPDRQPSLALTHGSIRRYRDQVHVVPTVTAALPAGPVTLPARFDLPLGYLEIQAAQEGEPGGRAGSRLTCQGSLALEFGHLALRVRVRGHSRRVQDLVREAAIPPWNRGLVPLLLDAEGVLMVPGIAERDGARQAASAGAPGTAGSYQVDVRWRPRVMQSGEGH